MSSPFIQALIHLLGNHPYIIIFIGMFFAGETVLLPAIYFALAGRIHLSYVIAAAIAATVASDFVWYYVGLHIKDRFAERMMNSRLQGSLNKLAGIFSKRATTVLFVSKFVYGTRTAAQVLSGIQKMPLRTYAAINFLGTFSLVAFIALLAFSLGETMESIQGVTHGVEIAFLAFVIILILTHLVLGVIFKRSWSQR